MHHFVRNDGRELIGAIGSVMGGREFGFELVDARVELGGLVKSSSRLCSAGAQRFWRPSAELFVLFAVQTDSSLVCGTPPMLAVKVRSARGTGADAIHVTVRAYFPR